MFSFPHLVTVFVICAITLATSGCGEFPTRIEIPSNQFHELWETPPPAQEHIMDRPPWPKGLSYDNVHALEAPDRVIVARVQYATDKAEAKKTYQDWYNSDLAVLRTFAFTGEDAKRIGRELINSTRDIPPRSDEWLERYVVRVEWKQRDGTTDITDFLVAAGYKGLFVKRPKEMRFCSVVPELGNFLEKVTR